MIEDVLAQLKGVRRCASCWSARCPTHEDHRNSLVLRVSENGNVLVKCYAQQCSFADIKRAVGLPASAWFGEPMKRKEREKMKIVKNYDYTDENGKLLYQTVRLEPKDFRQRQPDGKGKWKWDLEGVRRVLYNLPAVLASADEDRMVYVVEGEKDADTLIGLGLIATTNVCGAGKWCDEYTMSLRERRVVVVPDNDKAGWKHALQVVASFASAWQLLGPRAFGILCLVADPHKDVSDLVGDPKWDHDPRTAILDSVCNTEFWVKMPLNKVPKNDTLLRADAQ